ncbi:MAG: WG repeat-containing protein, partial [Oscillospiraceae bacterium]
KQILNNTADEDKYALIIELRDYAKSVDRTSAYIDACKQAVSKVPTDTESGGAVLDYMRSNADREIYSYVNNLITKTSELKGSSNAATAEAAAAAYDFYVGYYDTVKGDYKLSNLGLKSVSEWVNDTFAVGQLDEDNDVVINTAGERIVDEGHGHFDSYSPKEKYLATVHENQHVYMNLDDNRKLVPYNSTTKELVYYDYLGTFQGGIANFSYDNGKWGILNSNMTERYSGLEAAAAVSNNFYAIKSDGKWKIIYHDTQNRDGDAEVFTCNDLYLEDGYFINTRTLINNGSAVEVVVYARNDASSQWTAYKLTVDASDPKTYSAKSEALGSLSFEDVKLFGNGYGAVKLNGSWCFIDSKGEVVEAMGTHNDAKSLYCGLAAVQSASNKRWGYIDSKGNIIIDFQFGEANSLSSKGTAAVLDGSSWRLLRLREYD